MAVFWMNLFVVRSDSLPGLHARFDLDHLVRDVDHANRDLSGLGVVLTLDVVVHSRLQKVPQLRLRKSCKVKCNQPSSVKGATPSLSKGCRTCTESNANTF